GLVVHQHPRRFGERAGDELAAVDLDPVAALDRHADLGDLAVDLDQAVGDALFERAARTQARLREHLVEALFQARGIGRFVVAALERQLAAGGGVLGAGGRGGGVVGGGRGGPGGVGGGGRGVGIGGEGGRGTIVAGRG